MIIVGIVFSIIASYDCMYVMCLRTISIDWALYKYFIIITEKDTIREILKHVIENYKNNLPSDARMTLIDVLSRSDMPDTKVSDDMVTVFVAGFHSSSQCK